MSRIFDSIRQHPYFQRAAHWAAAAISPIRRGWNWIFAPVLRLFKPISDPFDAWFARFSEQNPRTGFALGWAGFFLKTGFQFLLVLVLCVWLGLFGRLPSMQDLRDIETSQTTEVYSADSVLIGKFFIENRTTIKLKDISPYVVTALIATEDKRFFTHSGIDFMSWLRVVKGMVTQQDGLGGGSTLSQQLAKNLYPRRNYYIPGFSLLVNKIRENFISVKLERAYEQEGGKAALLNMYLNTVPFGGDRFGIKVASKYFFDKEPRDLDAGEAATLVGMLKASTYYDPIRNPNNATERRNIVLRQMVRNSGQYEDWDDSELREMAERGNLSEEEFKTITAKKIKTKKGKSESNNDGQATYFREYLRTEVLPQMLKNQKKEDGSEYNLYRDGLRIYTTLDSRMQQFAEEAVQKHMAMLQKQFADQFKNTFKKEKPWGDDKWIDEQTRKSERWASLKDAGMAEAEILKNFEQPVKMTVFSWKNGGTESDTIMSPLDSVRYYFTMLNCGFMAMEHATGHVRAWVGGINFKYFKYDHVRSTRQVGSTFKPIVYAAAIADSIKPCDYYPNEITKVEDWEPHNANEDYGGYYSVAGALKNSINVVTAQIIAKVGIEKTIQLSRRMGITSKLPREFGISLGAADISLYEMATAYATIANRGQRPDPVVVTRIVTRDGKVLFDLNENAPATAPAADHQALNEWQAAVTRRMMQGVLDSGGTGARFRYAFGLYGDFAGKTGTTQNQSDGWFIAFNPRLVTGAWVGGASPAVRFRSMYLGQGSASALPICGWFWHKVAADRKHSKLIQEKFTEPKQDISRFFGCSSRIWVSPDSLWLLEADSVTMDSLHPGLFQKIKHGFGKLFGKNKPADGGEDSEIPTEKPLAPGNNDPRKDKKNKR